MVAGVPFNDTSRTKPCFEGPCTGKVFSILQSEFQTKKSFFADFDEGYPFIDILLNVFFLQITVNGLLGQNGLNVQPNVVVAGKHDCVYVTHLTHKVLPRVLGMKWKQGCVMPIVQEALQRQIL